MYLEFVLRENHFNYFLNYLKYVCYYCNKLQNATKFNATATYHYFCCMCTLAYWY